MPMRLFLAFSMGKRAPKPKSGKRQAPTRLPIHGKKDGNLKAPKHIANPAGGKDMAMSNFSPALYIERV